MTADMTGVGWHVEPRLADHYWQRRLDAPTSASIDAHLVRCDRCRAAIGLVADTSLIDDAWEALVDTIDQPQLGWVERRMLACGCSTATARIVAATSRARWAFLFVVAVSVLLAWASAMSVSRSDDLFVCFLIIAPLGPLAATATGFSGFADPTFRLTRTLPTSSLRVMLIRTVAGVVPAIVLTAMATPWLLDRGLAAMAWLLPTLAIASLTLALSTWLDVGVAAAWVAGVWMALPLVLRVRFPDLLDVLSGPIQPMSIVIAVAAALVTTVRRQSFEWGGR